MGAPAGERVISGQRMAWVWRTLATLGAGGVFVGIALPSPVAGIAGVVAAYGAWALRENALAAAETAAAPAASAALVPVVSAEAVAAAMPADARGVAAEPPAPATVIPVAASSLATMPALAAAPAAGEYSIKPAAEPVPRPFIEPQPAPAPSVPGRVTPLFEPGTAPSFASNNGSSPAAPRSYATEPGAGSHVAAASAIDAALPDGVRAALLGAAAGPRTDQSGEARRVAAEAVRIGTIMGLPTPELEVIHLAALTRDIGMGSLGDIGRSVGRPLTTIERALVAMHPRSAADELERGPGMRCAAPLVRHHHERYDGTGYPDRLAGNEIPLGARIIAVADAFVALTSGRPYRPALERVDAVREIIRNVGTQFDPAVVGAFTGMPTGSNRAPEEVGQTA